MVELIRTPAGWAYPDAGPCECGGTAATVGFQFCGCEGTDSGGHPAWRCRDCDAVRTLGCVGRIEVPNEYGGKRDARRESRTLDRRPNDRRSDET